MKLYLIAAIASNNIIGKDGGIPWKVKGDLPRFKEITMGHPVIMGRKTLESMGKWGPLPGRLNVVLTSQDALYKDGCALATKGGGVVTTDRCSMAVAGSFEEALALCGKANEVYVIGGGQVYAEALEVADSLRITHVHSEVEGDALFPEIDEDVWVRSFVEEHPDGTHTYVDYVRRSLTGL